MIGLFYLQSLVKWSNHCDLNEETAMRYDDLYNEFEKQFNPLKGETQQSEFDRWLDRFIKGHFTETEARFAMFHDRYNRTIEFKRIK